MKKISSLLMAVLVFVIMLFVSAAPSFAEDAPAATEILPDIYGEINVKGNRIISQQDEVQATSLRLNSGDTLTIAQDVTVRIADGDGVYNDGTIIVYGTLDARGPYEDVDHNNGTIIVYGTLIVSEDSKPFHNDGTIVVYGTLISGNEWDSKLYNLGEIIIADCCDVELIDEFNDFWLNGPEHVEHYYFNGVCGCGAEDSALTASTLSGGSIWIVAGIAVVAAGTVSALVITKKKKSTAANTEEE